MDANQAFKLFTFSSRILASAPKANTTLIDKSVEAGTVFKCSAVNSSSACNDEIAFDTRSIFSEFLLSFIMILKESSTVKEDKTQFVLIMCSQVTAFLIFYCPQLDLLFPISLQTISYQLIGVKQTHI